jgi:hypothetical protein
MAEKCHRAAPPSVGPCPARLAALTRSPEVWLAPTVGRGTIRGAETGEPRLGRRLPPQPSRERERAVSAASEAAHRSLTVAALCRPASAPRDSNFIQNSNIHRPKEASRRVDPGVPHYSGADAYQIYDPCHRRAGARRWSSPGRVSRGENRRDGGPWERDLDDLDRTGRAALRDRPCDDLG